MRTSAVILGTWVALAGCGPSREGLEPGPMPTVKPVSNLQAHGSYVYFVTPSDVRRMDVAGAIEIVAPLPEPMPEGCSLTELEPGVLAVMARAPGGPILAVQCAEGFIRWLGRAQLPTLACAASGTWLYLLTADSRVFRFDLRTLALDTGWSMALPGALYLQPYADGRLLAATLSDLFCIDPTQGTFTPVGPIRLSPGGDFAVSATGRIEYPCLETQSVVTARIEGGTLLLERTTPLPIQWTDNQPIAIAHPVGWLVIVIADVAFIRRDD